MYSGSPSVLTVLTLRRRQNNNAAEKALRASVLGRKLLCSSAARLVTQKNCRYSIHRIHGAHLNAGKRHCHFTPPNITFSGQPPNVRTGCVNSARVRACAGEPVLTKTQKNSVQETRTLFWQHHIMLLFSALRESE